jgi:hypothetical protein
MNLIIASFPRSGNHWVRYIVEYCTKLRTMGEGNTKHRTKLDMPVFDRIDPSFYSGDGYSGYKRHWLRGGDTKFPIIIIVRNYKEVFIRHNRKAFRGKPKVKPELTKMFGDYLNLLRRFDDWPKEKLLVYYEDLISDSKSIKKIIEFIGHSDKSESFISDIKEHRKKCLKICSHKTNGKKAIYYSQQVRPDWIVFLSKYFRQQQPIFKKYLSHY